VTADYAAYIDAAPSRAATATFRQLTTPDATGALVLKNGWTNAPFSTNAAEAALVSGFVQLRGAIGGGTSAVAFTLPSGFAPSANVYVPINLCNATKGRLLIDTTGTVSVQEEGGVFANAQCFTSLDGASFAVSAASFTALSLQNGWVNAPFSTRNAAVRNVSGIAHFEGAIANGTTSAPFTLPAGFRPAANVYIPVDLCNATKGRLFIQPTGAVTIQTVGALSDAQCFTSLEGASFALNSTGFSALSLQNGWVNTPFSNASPAVKNVAGIVRFEGAMSTSGTNLNAFTLPAAMRPATAVYVPVDLCNAQKGRLLILPTGAVSVQTISGGISSAQCFTSLDGASFGL
jgi:hypothetical protein